MKNANSIKQKHSSDISLAISPYFSIQLYAEMLLLTGDVSKFEKGLAW